MICYFNITLLPSDLYYHPNVTYILIMLLQLYKIKHDSDSQCSELLTAIFSVGLFQKPVYLPV